MSPTTDSQTTTPSAGSLSSYSVAESAIARWISLGVTSLTHPLLARIFADCFAPLGIVADWFEAEPFSGLESGLPDGWLRSPRWDPALSSATPDLLPWAARAAEIAVTADGLLRLPPSAASAGPGPGVHSHQPDPWLAVRHSIAARSRARALLCAAAGSLLFDPVAAAIYLDGNDEAFFRKIAERVDGASSPDRSDKSEKSGNTEPPTDRTADAAGESLEAMGIATVVAVATVPAR